MRPDRLLIAAHHAYYRRLRSALLQSLDSGYALPGRRGHQPFAQDFLG